MAVFNVKMLPFLLVMVLMCSDIVPACTPVPSYRFDFENQDGKYKVHCLKSKLIFSIILVLTCDVNRTLLKKYQFY